MSLFDAILNAVKAIKSKGNSNQPIKRFGSSENKATDEKNLKKDLDQLINMFPGSPHFLGKNVQYPRPAKRFFFFEKKLPDLAEYREAVTKKGQLEAGVTRLKINKLMAKYQFYPDVHALHAIQVFNDTAQSGLDEKKLRVIKESMVEMANALCNNGTSLFNITWFMKIYLKYLESLNDKYVHQRTSTSKHYLNSIQNLSFELHKKQVQLLTLLTVKEKLSGLTLLNQQLQGTSFFKEGLKPIDIKDAALAIMQEDEGKTISEGKTAKHIFWVIITLNLLFAKIPILKDLTQKTLSQIPDLNRDMILQKAMVNTMTFLTDFRIAYVSGDEKLAKTKANDLFARCNEIINQYLEYSILNKPYEIDPFLKAAWIVKESRELFLELEFKPMILRSIDLLNIVMGKRGQAKGSYEQASVLHDELLAVKLEQGWSEF